MNKNEYIASVLRTHQTNILKTLNQFDMGHLDSVFGNIADSLGNIAAEIAKMPTPIMAPGHQRLPFDPKPNSTVKKPKPAPRKPSPAALVSAA